ncbi:hypothetical protein L1987_12647 [Smallanthus sonchifolius]|uniref:Uncharacterized protein n=1 Tax=Smallanthus sonchifolius TaxID=185202 RepID=A0ACB9JF86_9ASTR|nr:hypothetical protein L1987_12647 [Smallanthus sonchifolius]
MVVAGSQPPPLASPTNRQRRPNKHKKGGKRKSMKQKWKTKKILNLTEVLNPIPFIPKALDLNWHEDVLKRLGLYEFSKIELDRSIRTDLLVQLIVNYDSKKRCSFVNEKKISVNRADLARALKLPVMKQDKGSRRMEEVDLDSDVFSDEAIDDDDGVGGVGVDEGEENVKVDEEHEEKESMVQEDDVGLTLGLDVEKIVDQEVRKDDVELTLRPVVEKIVDQEVRKDGVELTLGPDVEKIVDQEVRKDDVELTLGPDVEKIVDQEVGKDDETMVDAEECKGEVIWKNAVEKIVDQEVRKDDVELTLGPDFENIVDQEVRKDDVELTLGPDVEKIVDQERCQSTDLNDYEEMKVEVEDEQIEQVEDEDDEPEEEEEEEEGAGERFVAGFDMEANDDEMDRDGLTDNFPFGSHGVSSMDMFRPRDDSFLSHGGPSFFENGGKRVMESEYDMHHLEGNSKRLKTDDM